MERFITVTLRARKKKMQKIEWATHLRDSSHPLSSVLANWPETAELNKGV
jgi:hypothetical protein